MSPSPPAEYGHRHRARLSLRKQLKALQQPRQVCDTKENMGASAWARGSRTVSQLDWRCRAVAPALQEDEERGCKLKSLLSYRASSRPAWMTCSNTSERVRSRPGRSSVLSACLACCPFHGSTAHPVLTSAVRVIAQMTLQGTGKPVLDSAPNGGPRCPSRL